MKSLVLKQVNGETIMLPIFETAFIEKINGDCSVYVVANYHGKEYILDTTICEIQRLTNNNQMFQKIETKTMGF